MSVKYHFVLAVRLFSFLSMGYSKLALQQLLFTVGDFSVLIRECYVTLPSFGFICIA
jgi:hypothetical protein